VSGKLKERQLTYRLIITSITNYELTKIIKLLTISSSLPLTLIFCYFVEVAGRDDDETLSSFSALKELQPAAFPSPTSLTLVLVRIPLGSPGTNSRLFILLPSPLHVFTPSSLPYTG